MFGYRADNVTANVIYKQASYEYESLNGPTIYSGTIYYPIFIEPSNDYNWYWTPTPMSQDVTYSCAYLRDNYGSSQPGVETYYGVLELRPRNYVVDATYVIKTSDLQNAAHTPVIPLEYPSISYVLKPNLRLIRNNTNNVITLGLNEEFSYIPGLLVNNEFVAKTLQIDAPSEYDAEGNVISYSWLTYNSYTAEQWLNNYHLIGDGWNDMGSPWAYLNGITNYADNKTIYLDFEWCPSGTYLNVFTIFGDNSKTITDTSGNIISAAPQVFYDNLGPVVFSDTTIVVSNNRNEYPDNDVQDAYRYKLKPENTRFIEYTNSIKTVLDVYLFKDRYALSHDNVYFNRDTSLYGTVCGTVSSTNEESIPDAQWQNYLGLYLGESIPFLDIVEQNIPDSEILGVPEYDKQINTSETLKYGTVASASLTFTVNKPVDEAMEYNNDYLILYYDFENNNYWQRFGFFYIDSIESIDENTSRITAHDEAYKLNKYVDNFLENYQNVSTLKKFYTDLLDYCGCYYDSQLNPVNYGHLQLDNIYHAVKTTGTEVAHYIATISTGFIHADIDGDIKIRTYSQFNTLFKPNQYADLQYSAYDADIVNKVKITINNVVVGESNGNGENVYYVEDNPLISSTWEPSKLYELANDISTKYNLPSYRPATIRFLTYPDPFLYIGSFNCVQTKNGEIYYFAVMRMSVDASGITVQSFGTQTYPVEQSTTGQFVNLINNIDSVDTNVENLERAGALLGQRIQDAEDAIEELQSVVDSSDTSISSLVTRMSAAENNISAVSTNLTNKINSDAVTINGSSVSVKINGQTVSGIATKSYVDISANDAKAYARNEVLTSEAKNSISQANNLVTAKINNNVVPNITTKAYVDNVVSSNTVCKVGTLNYRRSGSDYSEFVAYVGKNDMTTGMFFPLTYTGGGASGAYFLWRVYNGTYGMLWDNGAGTYWIDLTSGSFTEQ